MYEARITEGLAAQLEELAQELAAERSALRAAEAPDRIAPQRARAIERALAGVPDDERLAVGVELAHRPLDTLGRDAALLDDS